MITSIRLFTTSIMAHRLCVCVVRTLKIYSRSNFQVYNTVLLTTVTTLYWLQSLKQCFSHLNTHMHHLGILLKSGFGFSRSEWGGLRFCISIQLPVMWM